MIKEIENPKKNKNTFPSVFRKKKKKKKKYHLIRRSLKKEISKIPSLSEKWKIHGKKNII
jgi:hypothetical protein